MTRQTNIQLAGSDSYGNIHFWFDKHMAIVDKINAAIAEYYECQLPDDWVHRNPG